MSKSKWATSMKNWLNQVTYGNATDNLLPYLQKGDFDFLFDQLKGYPFPENNSDAAQDEIRELLKYQNSAEQQNEEIITRFIGYDENPISMFDKYAKEKIGVDYGKELEAIVQDALNVFIKLKFYYQRPRPYQLAQYYKARLFPYSSKTAHTPSYPSGHTFEAFLVAEYLGSKHPEHYQFLTELANDISISRIFLGLHYSSDCDFGRFCAKKMIGTKQFAEKYGI